MKIIVTGSCGFIGFHLSEKLLLEGYNVIGIDNYNSYIYNESYKKLNSYLLKKYKNYIEIEDDILNDNYILNNNPDIVIHLAAYANVRKSIENPDMYIRNNVECTCKILKEISKCKKTPLLIYASSSSVYGINKNVPFKETDSLDNIISPYALSKKMCEELVELFCKTNKISAIGLRFFTVYGPGGRPDMAIFNFIKKIKFGEPITIYGDGSMQRDFTYVTDIVNGIYNCMFLNLNSGEHKLYNIGNNNPISLIKLIEICEEVIEKKAIIMYDNIPTGDVPITYANIDKAKNELKYIPSVNLLQGIKNMYSWFNNLNIKV